MEFILSNIWTNLLMDCFLSKKKKKDDENKVLNRTIQNNYILMVQLCEI